MAATHAVEKFAALERTFSLEVIVRRNTLVISSWRE
jgi:hypothetical protein